MKTLASVLGSLMGLMIPSLALAQATSQEAQEEVNKAAGTGCAACGGCAVFVIIAIVAIVALNIALLVWVARDAKARGMDSSVLWMFLVMFTGLIGLLIYIFSRPQGILKQCPNCKGKRLEASTKCPQCGAP